MIVCGETGSGKTTQLPKICLALGRGLGAGGAGLIGHTQPRRLAASSTGRRIAEELGTPFGEVVGYKVRFTDNLAPGASVKLMTDGILLAETQTDPLLKAYDTLIIDEAHERSLNIDFLLGYLRQILPRRPDLKLIVTSATIDAERPDVAVIDSIQTIYSEALTSAPGSVAQVRECAAQLTRIAKQSGTAIIMVGHVTKEGNLAGPRVLEHIVDTVLYFEGDTHSSFRLVRAFKNRFGAVNELGVFAMTERGLRGVANPSALFLSQHTEVVPGSCVLVTQEGTRPLLVEVQALVDTANVPNPRRLAVGLEQNRLAMLLAVLHRHAGIACFDQDVFLNAVGGVKITEPAADLAVLLAIHSSMRNKPLPKGLIVFGEVGLAGEIRPSPRGQERLREAAKLGFTTALIPKANAPKQPIDGLRVHAVERIEQAIDQIRVLE